MSDRVFDEFGRPRKETQARQPKILANREAWPPQGHRRPDLGQDPNTGGSDS
jgi:hypothetical protein